MLHAKQREMWADKHRFQVLSCVPAGEFIVGPDKAIEDCKIGESVIDFNGNKTEIYATNSRDYEDDLVVITARYIDPIKITKEHPMWISTWRCNYNNDALQRGERRKKAIWSKRFEGWVKAEELLALVAAIDPVYDKICLRLPKIGGHIEIKEFSLEQYVPHAYKDTDNRVCAHNVIRSFPLTPLTSWFLGLYAAEGHTDGSTVYFSLHEEEEEFVEKIISVFSSFGLNTTKRHPDEDSKGISVYARSVVLSRFIKELIGEHCDGKTIPDQILYHENREIRFNFLKGYLDGDGHYDTARFKLSSKTNSPALGYRLQLLVASLGACAGLHKGRRPKKSKILGRIVNTNDYYRMECTNISLYQEITGLPCEKNPREFYIPDDDCFWLPITKTSTEKYSGKVYNFGTENETYGLKNAISHNCGRRFGKSIYAAYRIIREALNKPDSVNWVVAPTYAATMLIWRKILTYCPEEAIYDINRTENIIYLINGSSIWAKTAERPDNLRGEGVDFLIMEEAGFIKEDVWDYILRPALADRKGRGIFISCVTKDTWTFTVDGLRRFQDLTDCETPDTWIPYNKSIASLGNTTDIASDIYVTGVCDTWKVTTAAGYKLEGTYNHPILVMDKSGEMQMRPLSDIQIGDRVAINRTIDLWGEHDDLSKFEYRGRISANSNNLDLSVMRDDLAYLMGLILGDGNVSYNIPYNITLTAAPDELDIHQFLKGTNTLGLSFSQYEGDPYHWTISNKKLTEFLAWYGFKPVVAKYKTIPYRLLSASKNTVAQFLSGLFDADGHSKISNGEVGFSSASEELIDTVMMLLLNFGIISRKLGHEVKPTKKVKVSSYEWQLSITGENANIFYEKIGFRINRKQENQSKLKLYNNRTSKYDTVPYQGEKIKKIREGNWYKSNNTHNLRHAEKNPQVGYLKLYEILERCKDTNAREEYLALKDLAELHYFWDTVKIITTGQAVTYDYHIPKSHRFVSNGYISSNTPKGHNFFYELFKLGRHGPNGEESPDPEWNSLSCSSWDNPTLDRHELEVLKRSLPPQAYRQEILAEFIDDAGAVFKNMEHCLREGKFVDPIWDHIYIMGVDLAKYEDYTVITVMDVLNRDVVYWERFNNIDWSTQKTRIAEIHERYNKCTVSLDSTGVGDPIADDLMKEGICVRPFRFTAASKPELIKKLQFATENCEYSMPRIDQLYNEMLAFSFFVTKSGQIRYEAPRNSHDDCVMSLALCVFHLDLVAPSLDGWSFY